MFHENLPNSKKKKNTSWWCSDAAKSTRVRANGSSWTYGGCTKFAGQRVCFTGQRRQKDAVRNAYRGWTRLLMETAAAVVHMWVGGSRHDRATHRNGAMLLLQNFDHGFLLGQLWFQLSSTTLNIGQSTLSGVQLVHLSDFISSCLGHYSFRLLACLFKSCYFSILRNASCINRCLAHWVFLQVPLLPALDIRLQSSQAFVPFVHLQDQILELRTVPFAVWSHICKVYQAYWTELSISNYV